MMKPLKLVTSTLTLMLLCTGASAAGAPRAQAGFGHAYAHRTCAPWDGAAIALTLQTDAFPAVAKGKLPPDHYPQIAVTLFTSRPPTGRWLEFGEASSIEGGGSIRECPAQGQCRIRVGRIRLTKVTSDRLEGELRIQVPGNKGQEFVYPFSAPNLPYTEFCG